MNILFKTLNDVRIFVVNVWNATIKRLREDLDSTISRVEITEEEIEEIEIDVEENSEEILATKEELQEVKDLLTILVFELVDQGVKIESPKLLELLENINDLIEY